VKALIPAAGVGTRLRPHTLNKPKALLPVAGRPIIGHIVDDLHGAGIDGFVVVVGYEGAAVREWFAAERAGLDVIFVEQRERLGLGHALWTARRAMGEEPFFCILGDTILKADYRALVGADHDQIAVREVEDPRRFGVVVLEGDRVIRFAEKPDPPVSNLAIVGAYLFRRPAVLWRALDRIVDEDIRTKGEYQLTDALQLMVAEGVPFGVVPVRDWYDCGKPETWLATNQALLEQEAPPAPAGVEPPCAIAPSAVLHDCRIGPYVSVGSGTVLEGCNLSRCVIGSGSQLRDCHLAESLVGDHCQVEGARGQINVGDFSELQLTGR
jgi:glucose-1-phosphate thymidylyltransferase